MPKYLRKFRKKGHTFDQEYSVKQKSFKQKKKTLKISKVNKDRNYNTLRLLTEEEE